MQLLKDVEHLHSCNILHRDLKPANLFINLNCHLKIFDFGMSRIAAGDGEPMKEDVGTQWCSAPEILLSCRSYGASADIWSVGCILAEILGSRQAFPGKSRRSQLRRIIRVVGTQAEADLDFIDKPRKKAIVQSILSKGVPFSDLFPDANPSAVDLLSRLLVFDPSKRITAAAALAHPYISALWEEDGDAPPRRQQLSFEIDGTAEEHVLRTMMLREILHYHPDICRTEIA